MTIIANSNSDIITVAKNGPKVTYTQGMISASRNIQFDTYDATITVDNKSYLLQNAKKYFDSLETHFRLQQEATEPTASFRDPEEFDEQIDLEQISNEND